MPGLDPTTFAGLFEIVEREPDTQDSWLREEDDLEGEQETVPKLKNTANTIVAGLLSTVNEASRGVSDKTQAEYQR